jgi:alcohol dehydrogenase (cytochrome c)
LIPHKRIAVCLTLAGAAFAQAPPNAAPEPLPSVLRNYRPATAERLLKPDAGDWLMARRTFDGWGYSPLDQITPQNVERLQPVWVLSTGVNNGHEAIPLVNNGVMFVSTPGSQVLAIDVKSGRVLWRFHRELAEDVRFPHPTSRGVALYGDQVFFAAGDAVLVALDVRTGKELWSATVEDNQKGYYISAAPMVVGGKVMIGTSGGDGAIRGFVAAFDADTGKELWRTFTIPAPGEPGNETWQGDQWKRGGGSTWVNGNYDPETNLAFWGTGNAAPWMADLRPGDNLYTSSTIAIDVATGKIRGYHQYTPNESWDWDEVSPPILVDFKRNGTTIKGLIDVARDGYLWFLARTEGPIHYVEAKPFVKQNVFKSVDPETGRPEIDPEHKPGTGKVVDFCPSHWGGKNWPPIAFSPKTRMIYIPANENLCDTFTVSKLGTPGRSANGTTTRLWLAPGADHIGEVQAWNVDTGSRVWTHHYTSSHNWAGLLATGGGLVFGGGTNDRMFHAFDASRGTLVWEFPTNSGIVGPPMSFLVDGKQYIAVQAGWGLDARSIQARLNTQFPGRFPEVPEGGAIWVFAVK